MMPGQGCLILGLDVQDMLLLLLPLETQVRALVNWCA